jgi:hypothetical protein
MDTAEIIRCHLAGKLVTQELLRVVLGAQLENMRQELGYYVSPMLEKL